MIYCADPNSEGRAMRGEDQPRTAVFSVLSMEGRIPADHPLRTIQALVNPILVALAGADARLEPGKRADVSHGAAGSR